MNPLIPFETLNNHIDLSFIEAIGASANNVTANKSPPFLKWPGGKRWLALHLCPLIDAMLEGRYYEPFLGGGAMFFALRPRRATLSDVNEDLINTYRQIRSNSDKVVDHLKTLQVSKSSYYKIRSSNPKCQIQRASRFLYLNRTSFSGLYRLNKKGEFNVPYGGGDRTPNILWETDILTNASTLLRNRKLISLDFEETMLPAGEGDVIYCDPTYTVSHNHNGFVRYNENNFSWKDQQRLASACKDAARRGATVFISNAAHESIANLYKPYSPIALKRNSLLSSVSSKRRLTNEFLFIIADNK